MSSDLVQIPTPGLIRLKLHFHSTAQKGMSRPEDIPILAAPLRARRLSRSRQQAALLPEGRGNSLLQSRAEDGRRLLQAIEETGASLWNAVRWTEDDTNASSLLEEREEQPPILTDVTVVRV